MSKLNRWIERVLLLLIVLLALSFSITKIFDYDIWWHLKTGEYIWKEFRIPYSDFFSLTAEGKEWIDVHWLSQILFYAVFKLLGLVAIQILTAGVVIYSLYSLYRIGLRREFIIFILPFLYFAIYASKDRFLPRPDIFTLLFTVIFFCILYSFKFHKRKVYQIPLVQVLWSNMHGSFVLGPLMILAFLAGEILEWFMPSLFYDGKEDREDKTPRKKVIILLIVFIFSIMATLVNPYGIRIYSLHSTYVGSFLEFASPYRGGSQPISIQEWLPTFSEMASKYHHTFLRFYLFMAIAGFTSFVLNIRKFSPALFFVFSGSLLLSAFAIRNVSIFSLLAAAIAAHNLGESLASFSSNVVPCKNTLLCKLRSLYGRKIPVLLYPFILLFLFLLIFSIFDSFSNRYYIRHSMPLEAGFGISKFPFPAGGARFVQEHGIQGNMYNNFESGGYLIWVLYPGYRVFTDGRYIDPAFDRIHMEAAGDFRKWKELAERYDVEFTLLKYPANDTARLIADLSNSGQWKMVYLDPNSTIFLKDSGRNGELIDRFGRTLPPFPERKYLGMEEVPLPEISFPSKGYEGLLVHPFDRCFLGLQKFLESFQNKMIPVETLNQAYFLHLTGFLNASAEMYRRVLKEKPDYIPAHHELALIYAQMGNHLPELEKSIP
ncbi:MAG: hypothetical protein AB1756_07390 [Acidobacteriota bacterium]